MKSTTVGLALFCLFSVALLADVLSVDSQDVVWNTPGVGSQDSMPLGNGDIALNAWFEKSGDLVFLIGKSDAWSGDLDSPGYGAYGLLKLGRVRVSFSPNPFLGAPGLEQRLRLREGTMEVHAGAEGARSHIALWVDANQPVIRMETDLASPVSIQVSLESWRQESTRWLAADTIPPIRDHRLTWFYRNPNKDIPQLVNLTTGASIEGRDLVGREPRSLVSQAPAKSHLVSIHPLTAQCATSDEWTQRLERQISITHAVPRDKARQAHLAWWRAFWDRSHVYLTAGEKAAEVTRGYTLQRFISACAGRGAHPIKFNGSLFVVDNPTPVIIKDKTGKEPDIVMPVTPDYRSWGHQYWFQNTRASYWPMLASGDFDLMQPFLRMYRAMLENNKRQIREFYGHDGAYFRETAPFWGGLVKITPETPGRYTTHYYIPILEYSAMALDYHAHTGDRIFARDTLIPVADAGITFYDKHFSRDASGKLYISPANAAETYWKVNNPTPDIAGLRWVLDSLLQLPQDLTTSSQRERWQRLLAELPAIPIREIDGRRLIQSHESPSDARALNKENPELYAIYPFRHYGLGKPDLELARASFEARRNKWFGCWSQDAVQAAFLGDTATAKAGVIRHLTARDPRLRFPAFWPKGYDYPPDQDNGGNGMLAIQTMLLQTEGDRILVLPAWPVDWDVDFKLHAPGKTTVAVALRSGKIFRLTVDPPARRADVILPAGLEDPKE